VTEQGASLEPGIPGDAPAGRYGAGVELRIEQLDDGLDGLGVGRSRIVASIWARAARLALDLPLKVAWSSAKRIPEPSKKVPRLAQALPGGQWRRLLWWTF
jgi:hypothetical protein